LEFPQPFFSSEKMFDYFKQTFDLEPSEVNKFDLKWENVNLSNDCLPNVVSSNYSFPNGGLSTMSVCLVSAHQTDGLPTMSISSPTLTLRVREGETCIG